MRDAHGEGVQDFSDLTQDFEWATNDEGEAAQEFGRLGEVEYADAG